MKLYWSPRSPYVRLVSVTAHELGLAGDIAFQRTLVNITAPHEELLERNPLCKIPTLVIEDGTSIYDSRTICEYLDMRAGGGLLPASGPERLVEMRRVALGVGLIDLLLSWLLERNRPPEKQEPAIIEALKVKYGRVMDELEAMAPSLAAGPFRMGHIALGCALSYSDFRFVTVDWRAGRPALAAWHAAFVERPSYKADPFFDEIAAEAAAAAAAAAARA